MKTYRMIIKNTKTGITRTIDRELDEDDFLAIENKFKNKKVEDGFLIVGLFELTM